MAGRHVALGDGDEARQARLGGQEVVAVAIEAALADQKADRQQLPGGIEEKAELHGVEESARLLRQRAEAPFQPACRRRRACQRVDQRRRPVGPRPGRRRRAAQGLHRRLAAIGDLGERRQRLEQLRQALGGRCFVEPRPGQQVRDIALVIEHARLRGQRPDQDEAGARVAALLAQRLRHVGDRVGVRRQDGEVLGQLARARRADAHGGAEGVERRIERLASDRLRAAIVGHVAQRLLGQGQGVVDAAEPVGAEHRRRDDLATGAAERDQVPGEVAAIHRRHILRLEGPQIAGVVPIVEVPVEALEPGHRRERGLQAVDEAARPDPAEVAGGGDRQQIEADVGRRGAVRDDRTRVFLEVVGRQHVIVCRDEGLEKAPRAAGDEAQGLRVRGGKGRDRDRRRPARPLRRRRRQHPQQQHRRRDQPGALANAPDKQRGDHRQRDAADHAPVKSRDVERQAELGLRGGEPLQQPAPADEEAIERAHDRIGHQPGLVGEHGHREGALRQRQHEVGAQGEDVAALRDPLPPRQDAAEGRQQRGQGQQQHHRRRPQRGGGRRQHPAGYDGEKGGRSHGGAAQVVEHLPAAEQRHRSGRRDSAAPKAREDPRQQLPVAARPAVLARRGDVVASRELLDDLDVGDQTGAREGALEQVVTEQAAVRHAPGQRRLEDVDVVDAFAGEGPLTEQILVDVGDRRRVGIHAAGTGEGALEPGALAADRQGRRDARLQHAVALDDAAAGRRQPRRVQRVRHLADQAPGGASWQARVGVERDDVADVGGRDTVGAAGGEKSRVGGAAQQPVEFVQLAALALPADPLSFPGGPDAAAVEEQEARAAGSGAVAAVQVGDARRRHGEQLVVVRPALRNRVHPIREEGEMELVVRIRQVVHFQALNLLLDGGACRQQHRHGHQRPEPRRHAVAQLHAGQLHRADAPRDMPVDQRQRRLRGRQRPQQRQGAEHPSADPALRRRPQRQGQQHQGHAADRCDIAEQAGGAVGAGEPLAYRDAVADRALEAPALPADQRGARIDGVPIIGKRRRRLV